MRLARVVLECKLVPTDFAVEGVMPDKNHPHRWYSIEEQTRVYHFCGRCGASAKILVENLRTLPPANDRQPCGMCERMLIDCAGDCEYDFLFSAVFTLQMRLRGSSARGRIRTI